MTARTSSWRRRTSIPDPCLRRMGGTHPAAHRNIMKIYPLLIPVFALLLLSASLAATIPHATPLETAQGIEAQRNGGPYEPTPRACAFVCDVQRHVRFF
jgi:hypothetical protein